MNLEQRLRHAAPSWLDKERSAPEDEAALELLVRRLRKRRLWGRTGTLGGAVAAVVLTVFFWPMMLSLASGLPVVGPYLAQVGLFDPGVRWADEHGYVVPVDQEVTRAGYTLRVDSYFADSARTTVFFTVHGPGLAENGGLAWAPTFNLLHPGNYSGSWREEDGYLVGQLDLPALPLPLTRVSLSLSQIAGVRDTWSVSFLASRRELGPLGQTIQVDQPLGSGDTSWTMRQITLAPTRTLIEMEGHHGDEIQIRAMELWADGQPVKIQGLSTHGVQRGTREPLFTYTIRADRVEGEPTELLLRLTDVIRWIDGGPSIALEPGAGAHVGDVQIGLESVQATNGETIVTLRLTGAGQPVKMAPLLFQGWELIDGTGARVAATSDTVRPDGNVELLTITFPQQLSGTLHVQPLRHAEPLAGPFELRIPRS